MPLVFNTTMEEAIVVRTGGRGQEYRGCYSGIAISGDHVAFVADQKLGTALHYRGGKIVQGENVNWDVFEEYGSGKYPSLALIKKSDTTYAIEVHCGSFTPDCYYNVFEVRHDTAPIKKVSNGRLGFGFRPKVAATDDGTVVVMYEANIGYGIYYAIGSLKTGGPGLDIFWRLRWQPFPFNGKNLAVSICRDKILVVYKTNLYTLKSVMGTLKDFNIEWDKDFHMLPFEGFCPAVSLNAKGNAILCYESFLSNLTFAYGEMKENNMVWMEEAKAQNTIKGNYPSIAITDDLLYFEVHKTGFLDLQIKRGRIEKNDEPDNIQLPVPGQD